MNRVGNDGDISLRPCTYADLGQVCAIEQESFPEGPYPPIVFANLLVLAGGASLLPVRAIRSWDTWSERAQGERG